MKKTFILSVVVLLFLVASLFFVFDINREEVSGPTNFEECAHLGYAILKSIPRQCRTPDNQIFHEIILSNESAKLNLIRVTSVEPRQVVESPLKISGFARGFWFFEASFPIELRSLDDEILSSGIATAQKDWMTEEFVPFEAVLEFKPSLSGEAKLILRKDNPSGLPEHDDFLILPVILNRVERQASSTGFSE